ncbi:MAG: PAS domain-containing protein [Rhizobiales bacterium]|nr:PAS domain-containing protein [Hyphomicrobiales bacterium]
MADALSNQSLSNLIGSIYDCALEPALWEKTLAEIRDALCCQTAGLQMTDLRHGRFLINRTVGIEPYWLEQQEKHVPEINARLAEHFASSPSLDAPHVVSLHVPQAYIESSPYFQHCVKPGGIVDLMTYLLMQTPARIAGFGFGRSERQGIFTAREIALSGLLLPHVRRAVTISNVIDVRTIEHARMAEALDTLRCAVVLTDGRGAILHANGAAERMLGDRGLVHGAGGVLAAKAPAAAAELSAAIALAAQDETGIGKTGLAIRLTDGAMPPVFAHVMPLTGSDLRTRLKPSAAAAVFISATPDEQDAAAATALAFGLTPAETRVLASLLAGRTLAETAAALDIAASTAKTHLDHIFWKTGVTRQADLMRLGTGLVPPTRSKM